MNDRSSTADAVNVQKPEHYTILPARVRYDKNLSPNAKIIYSEIKSLAHTSGVCWASNAFFAELFDADNSAVSKWISQLKNAGYITISLKYKMGSKEVEQRLIRLTDLAETKSGGIDKFPIGSDINQYVLKNEGGGIDKFPIGIDIYQQVLKKEEEVLIKEEEEYYNTNSIMEKHNFNIISAPASEPSPAIAATVPPGADEEKIRNFVERIPLDVLKGFEDMSFNKFLELTENDIKDYSLQLKYFQSIQRRIENLSQEKTKGVLHPEIKKKETFNPEIIKTEIKKEQQTSILNPYDDDYWI